MYIKGNTKGENKCEMRSLRKHKKSIRKGKTV